MYFKFKKNLNCVFCVCFSLVNYTNPGLEYQVNIMMHEYNNHYSIIVFKHKAMGSIPRLCMS